MKIVLLGLAALAVVHAGPAGLDMDSIIKHVNEAHSTWTAGHNFAPNTPLKYYKSLMGARVNANGPTLKKVGYSGVAIPEEFDARKQWPLCTSIAHLRDQGTCGSCWAVAGAAAFSDRVCIASKGNMTDQLSAEELLSCCDSCGDGCEGGYPSSAWQYFVDNGLVSGGDYKSGKGCQPYSIPSCEHHTQGPRPQCSSLPTSETPECERRCTNNKYTRSFRKDHHKASTVHEFDSVEAIQEDLMKHGPVEAAFTVYGDFVAYKSGVYQQLSDTVLGGHAVRVIGWGTENGTPYWLVTNSWNNDWGDKGLFKIIRGQDECGFESGMVAGHI